jgi:lysylphosphatidylglycerol synthetase-like protein (DUF2156 family)
MKTTIIKKLSLTVAAFALAITALLVPVVPVSAQNSIKDGIDSAKGEGVPDKLFGDGSIFTSVVNVMLFIIGAICVIMLIYGGIRYTTSGGNATNVTAAKNTILYAIIGLVIAFLAFAVVNWVLTQITPTGGAV